MRRIFKMMGEILILSTLVVIMAVGVSAKENNISWTFRDDTKTLTIRGDGVVEYNRKWKKLKPKHIKIEEGIDEIGYYAFSDIPDTVKVIKTGAFEGTEGIRKIVIPSEVKRIHDDTFKECKDLETIVFNKKVRSIGENAFAKCEKLKSVTIPGNVKTIEYKAFEKSGCKEVIISKGVKEIDYRAFNNCDQLEKVSISDTVSVISDNSFANCDKLTQIAVDAGNKMYASVNNSLLNKNKTELLQVPGGKRGVYEIPATVTKVYPQAFYGCKNLTGIASTDNSNFKSVDGILYDRTGTKLISSPINKTGTIVIPSNVLIIGESAFQNSKASQIIIPSSVVSMEQCAFEYCNNLTYMKIPGNVEKVSQAAFWECDNLRKVIIESGTKKIQRNAFHGCGKLRKIVVPISVYFINETAFSECWRVSLYCKKSSCAMSFANKHDYRYKVI